MPPFLFDVLFIPSFHVLSGYFYVSLNFVAVPTIWILNKCRDNLILWFGALQCSAWYKKEAFCAIKVNLVTYFQFWGEFTFLKKWIRTVSNFINFIQFHLICQMLAKFPGWIPKDGIYKFPKKKRKFLCCVHRLHKAGAWN